MVQPHLLHLSTHASGLWESLLDDSLVSSYRASSRSANIFSGLGKWWIERKVNRIQQSQRLMVTSDDGNRIAIIDGYKLSFLSRENEFAEPIANIRSSADDGAYMNGTWLESFSVFAALVSSRQVIVFDITGRELHRVSLCGWKINDYVCGMFVKHISSLERCSLTILLSNCDAYQIQYGKEGFLEPNPHTVSCSSLKRMYPQGLLCSNLNSEQEIIVVVGLSRTGKVTKSAGWFRLSIWKLHDCWSCLDLLGYVDIESFSVTMSPASPLKVIMSPKCNYIMLIESSARLRLICLQHEQGWTLKEIQITRKDDLQLGCTTMESGVVKKMYSKFSYFEVATEFTSASETRKRIMPEFLDVKGAFWWSDNAIAILDGKGSLFIISIPDLDIISEYMGGFSSDELHVIHGIRREIFMLDNSQMEMGGNNELTQIIPKAENTSWRLLILHEVTIPEFFVALLQSEEYDLALSFAEKYDLEKESVYKEQWLQSNYEIKDMEGIFPKILDKRWILKECLERVCPSMEAMSALLQHGLHLLEMLMGSWSFDHAVQDSLIGGLCLKRLRILQYIDRLETYLDLNMGRYNAKDYKIFRSTPLPDVAVRLAAAGKLGALFLLYKHHMHSLTPCLLRILDAIPETVSPHMYAQLLPQLSPPKPHIPYRERDQVEEEDIKYVIEKFNKDEENISTIALQESTEYTVEAFVGFIWPSEEKITEWYRRRAIEIDSSSGQLENSLRLLDLGRQKGLLSLEDLWNDLSALHWVIYSSVERDDDVIVNLSVDNWQMLSDYGKFKHILKGVDETNVIDRLKDAAIPFVRQKTIASNLQQDVDSFLAEWLKEIARDQLQICEVVFVEACKTKAVFDSDIKCIQTGLYCVYASTRIDQWHLMMSILSKLSSLCMLLQINGQTGQSCGENLSEEDDVSHDGLGTVKKDVHIDLYEKLQRTIGYVEAGLLLAQYQVPKPIGFFEANLKDERGVKQLIILILSKFSRRQPVRSDVEWSSMWDDLQRLQSKAFNFLNKQFLFLEYYRGLLKAGKFSLAKSQLRTIGNNMLPLERIEAVIIQVAREYFYSASSLDSPEIEKARMCLSVLPDSRNVAVEIEVIDAVTVKLPTMGVSLLPMQFKQIKDPMQIVKKILINNSFDGNFEVCKVLDIAKSLGMNTDDHIAMVEEMIAREAAGSGNFSLALSLCLELIKRDYGHVWDLCAAVARGPDVEGLSLQVRKQFIGFALGHCDEASVCQLLNDWKQIDISERCIEIQEALSLELPYDDSSCNWGMTVKDGKQLLFKVTECLPDAEGETFLSKGRKEVLERLCLCMPWLLQASGMDSVDSLNRGDYEDLSSKSLSTILLGLGHTGLIPKDDLVCRLAQMAIHDVSKESKSQISCGYLLNLKDNQKAIELLEDEIKGRQNLEEKCEVLRLALMYGVFQDVSVSKKDSPKRRRESSKQCKGEFDADQGASGYNAYAGFWKQWCCHIQHRLHLVQHALELEPFVASFDMDKFAGGNEDYVKYVVQSLADSAKSCSPPTHVVSSRVCHYQNTEQTFCNITKDPHAAVIKFNINALENVYGIFRKYISYLNMKDKWVAVKTLFSAASRNFLEDKEACCKENLSSFLCFWIGVFRDTFDDAGKAPFDALSGMVMESLLDLKSCCQAFVKLIKANVINSSQAYTVLNKFLDVLRCGEIKESLAEVMILSGCSFQSIFLVWCNIIEESKCMSMYDSVPSRISDIYIRVMISCILAFDDRSSDEYCYQLDPIVKVVSSLSSDSEIDYASLGLQTDPLQVVRTHVWKTLNDYTDNPEFSANLRVFLLKIHEAILSANKKMKACDSFDDYLQRHVMVWAGWKANSMGIEKKFSVQQNLVALKTSKLLSSVWHDLDVSVEDFDSVDKATMLFKTFAERIEVVGNAILLVRILEAWMDVFGWETTTGEEILLESEINRKEHVRNNAEWGEDDGWDNVWDEDDGEKYMSNNHLHMLHECWKTVFIKLALCGALEEILKSLDGTRAVNGRKLLTEQESYELIYFYEEESPVSALKISLLLPYGSVQEYALDKFEARLKHLMSDGTTISVICKMGTMNVDECLLSLLLASENVVIWAGNARFSATFCLLSTWFIFVVQTNASDFTLSTVFPLWIASLVLANQSRMASILVLQVTRVHPSLMTWNAAFVALEIFLKGRMSRVFYQSDDAVEHGLICMSNTRIHLQSLLSDKLSSALKLISK